MRRPIMIYVGGLSTFQPVLDANKDRFDVMFFVDHGSAYRVLDLLGPEARTRVALVMVEDKITKQMSIKHVNGNLYSIMEDFE